MTITATSPDITASTFEEVLDRLKNKNLSEHEIQFLKNNQKTIWTNSSLNFYDFLIYYPIMAFYLRKDGESLKNNHLKENVIEDFYKKMRSELSLKPNTTIQTEIKVKELDFFNLLQNCNNLI